MNNGYGEGYGSPTGGIKDLGKGMSFYKMNFMQCLKALIASILCIGTNPDGFAGGIKAFKFDNIKRAMSINTDYANMSGASTGLISTASIICVTGVITHLLNSLLGLSYNIRWGGVAATIGALIGTIVACAIIVVIDVVFIWLLSKFYDYWKSIVVKIIMVLSLIATVGSMINVLTSVFGLITFSIYDIVAVANACIMCYTYLMMVNYLTYAVPYIDNGNYAEQPQVDNQYDNQYDSQYEANTVENEPVAEVNIKNTVETGIYEAEVSENVEPVTEDLGGLLCKNCGATLEVGKKFCSSCGTAVN